MGLGTRKIKTEMTGTGGGRWMRRAEAKAIANKARRQANNTRPRMAERTCERCGAKDYQLGE